MKSIVDKLVSRIDAIEQSGSTSGGNESGEVKEHTHTVEQITDLDTKLSGYALSSHTHTVEQITDLDTSTFATKEELSGFSSRIQYSELPISMFSDGRAYIPIGEQTEQSYDAKFFIRVNEESYYRYYIEVLWINNSSKSNAAFKVFKCFNSPSDSTTLTFNICSGFSAGLSVIFLKVSGISTISTDTFDVFEICSPETQFIDKTILPRINDEQELDNAEYIPVYQST